MRKAALVAVLLSAALLPRALSAQPSPTIQGAWRTVEVTTTGPGGSTNTSPQPSLVLFTGKYYSVVSVMSAEARPPFQDPANVTPEEALAVWGPFVAQAGTYETADESLTVRPQVAKNPSAMVPGVAFVFSFRLDGDTLTVTTSGENPTTLRLERVD